jgi:membrane protease YdiL (CAAX protease family)
MPDDAALPESQPPTPLAPPATEPPANAGTDSARPPQSAQPAAAPIRCPNCGRQFPSKNKFCPGCGRSRADLDAFQMAKRSAAQTDREARHAWNHVHRLATFYVIVLVLNFVAAYVLPMDDAWGMLMADSVIIVVSLGWFFSDNVVRGASFKPGFSIPVLMLVPLSAVITFAVAVADNQLVMSLLGLNDDLGQRIRGMDAFNGLVLPLPVLIVSVCVIPGIFEEIFFRGLMQGSLEKVMTRREALLVQAVVFAIAHVNPIGFFTYLVFLGFWLGWLRNRSNSLIPGMLVHFCHNLLAVLSDRYGFFR